MSFLSGLFGGSSAPASPPPATPNVASASANSTANPVTTLNTSTPVSTSNPVSTTTPVNIFIGSNNKSSLPDLSSFEF